MADLRVALIGYGLGGRSFHAPMIMAAPGMKLTQVVTANADRASQARAEIPGVTIVGNAAEKASVLSFTIENVHPHDIGTILDQQGIAVRAGHHCAQPVMQFFDVPATARASFAFYNTREEVDKLADAVQKVIEVFA